MSERKGSYEIDEKVELAYKEAVLRELFLSEAKVTNYEKGYVDLRVVNQEIDPVLQGFAADIITDYFKDFGINKIVGIPTVGVPLATAVSERMKLLLALGRKGLQHPGSWKNTIIIKEEVPSFTTGKKSEYVYNSLNSGDKVLIVDDVIAHGHTSEIMIRNFRKHGIEACVAVYFAKLFQPGVAKLRSELGVDPFYAIGIEEISEDKIVRLSTPHF